MTYRVTGIGANGVALEYEKASLTEALYLASKMADFGARSARIFDPEGNEIILDQDGSNAGRPG